MPEPVRLELPLSREKAAGLRAGDEVRLFGPVFTARDATHVRLAEELSRTGELPFGLEGQTLFYAGPTPAAAGRPLGAVGPTTASRMDAWTPDLMAAGIAATIGKGPRTSEIARACGDTGGVYLAALGGAAAYLAARVTKAEVVGYAELGTEALMRLELDDFPGVVAIDASGREFFHAAWAEWRPGA